MMNSIRFLTLVAFLHLSGVAAFAQTPLLDSGAAPHVDLTSVQQQTVYQSISKTQKNNAAPTGFRAAVGALVPNGVSLAPVPATIAELIPQTRGLESAMIEGQVVLVEPKGKSVVAVIVDEP
jgi:Protein of unknown function (DUF1236)